MSYKIYRRAKRIDLLLQGIVVIMLLISLVEGPGWDVLGFFFLLGAVQVLGWFIWLFATPRACWNSSRKFYSIAMPLALLYMYIGGSYIGGSPDSRNAMFEFMMLSGSVLGLFYLGLTLIETSKEDEFAE